MRVTLETAISMPPSETSSETDGEELSSDFKNVTSHTCTIQTAEQNLLELPWTHRYLNKGL